jgi:mono/diheme cytochrome c family protein
MSHHCLRQRSELGSTRRRWQACLTLVTLVLVTACGDGTGGQSVDPNDIVQLGKQLFQSEGCVHCHGDMGQGVTAPALRDGRVVEDFPVCADQIHWVTLGSARWLRDVGPTYGAQSKPVKGGMPGFGNRLDEEQLRSVVTFTRVEFGGLDAAEATSDCFK